ncbi:MAG: YmdB family metallophosphoesterase [Deltaproteobacteria bacterium]|nr:YmdB family metallophosphoesterase [Deltaproteobacteria bacterium]MBI3293391.1 YmdB family metallophosphoesterase [Deltaproteobacteria bacterium]
MVILVFGDIFGKPGRRAIRSALPGLVEKYKPDFIFGNAENIAGGKGTNWKTMNEMLSLGFHGLTGGNHSWDNKEVYQIFEVEERLLRPINLPSSDRYPCPGKGARLFRNSKGESLFVINALGRVFMDNVQCPFHAIDEVLETVNDGVPVLVDFHADATSEKTAMGWHLDGRVTAVVGTHSHVQTADERILPRKTAFICDIGMSGSFDSVIGMAHQEILQRYLTKRPVPFKTATENPGVGCVVITTGERRTATKIERVRMTVNVGPDGDTTND